jgi:hypothetical protein
LSSLHNALPHGKEKNERSILSSLDQPAFAKGKKFGPPMKTTLNPFSVVIYAPARSCALTPSYLEVSSVISADKCGKLGQKIEIFIGSNAKVFFA